VEAGPTAGILSSFPFKLVGVESVDAGLSSEVDDMDDDDKDGAPEFAAPADNQSDTVSIGSAGTTNPMVDPPFGLDGIGDGAGVGVGVEYGARFTICRLKHS
jgi:hypothetical protein